MTREDLDELREKLFEAYKQRVALGDYDVDAGTLRACVLTLYRIVDHLLGKETKLLPKRKKK